jgi:hypothetical protein
LKEFNTLPSDPSFKALKDTQMFWLQINLMQDYKEEKQALKSTDRSGMKDIKKEKDIENEDLSANEFASMMGERHKMEKKK